MIGLLAFGLVLAIAGLLVAALLATAHAVEVRAMRIRKGERPDR